MCALSMLLIISCSKKKDEPVTPEQPKLPTIEFVNAGENYVYQDTEVISGDSVGFQLRAVATDSKDLLTSIEFKATFDGESNDTIIDLDKVPSYVFTVEPTPMELPSGVMTIEAKTTTKSGKSATAKVNITVVEAELEVEDLEWVRDGGDGIGLDQFGLKWHSNYKDICASIKPVEGAVLAIVDDVVFEDVTTEMDKMEVFDNANPVAEFHEISCTAGDKDIDYTLCTYYNENVYLIHLTNVKNEDGSQGATKTTITGQWK